MKKIIFAIHGIRSGEKNNWIHRFTAFARKDPRSKGDIFKSYTYGYVLAAQSVSLTFKYNMINKLKDDLRRIIKKYPEHELNIVAHSYGTLLSFQAIKRSGEDGRSVIKANKLILVASVVSRHREISYKDTFGAGKIKQLHCYCSFKDKICKNNPFGHSGYAGFSKDRYDRRCYAKPIKKLEIHNHQVKTVGHSEYFKGHKFYKQWLDIIHKP